MNNIPELKKKNFQGQAKMLMKNDPPQTRRLHSITPYPTKIHAHKKNDVKKEKIKSVIPNESSFLPPVTRLINQSKIAKKIKEFDK